MIGSCRTPTRWSSTTSSLDGPLKFMADWCNDHPLADFVDGAGQLVEELYPKRKAAPPE